MPIRILVLCTGNSARSQMAEGLFRHFGREKVTVFSAGTAPNGIHPVALQAMSELEIDISQQTSKYLDTLRQHEFDYIFTVCDHAADICPTFPGPSLRIHWSHPDPAAATGSEAQKLQAFREVRDALAKQIEPWLKAQA